MTYSTVNKAQGERDTMTAQGRDDFQIVNDCLSGLRPVDHTAFESVAVLSERLERLKKASILFRQISPSPHLAELSKTEQMSTIC